MRILLYCADAGDQRVKLANIAQRLGISQLNVFKIAHLLSRAGLISATRGRNGGVRLARPAADIRIGEIVRKMESTDVEVAGLAVPTKSGAGGAKPQLNAIFDDALEAFIGVLDQHSLADLVSTKLLSPPVERDRRLRRPKSVKAPRGTIG